MSIPSRILVATAEANEVGRCHCLSATSVLSDRLQIVFSAASQPDAEYLTQVALTEEYIKAFLTNHPFRELVQPDRRTISVRIEHISGEELRGGSHGLALLVLALSELLRVPPRLDHVFSARLSPPSKDPALILLDSVFNISAKAVAVGAEGASSLFFHHRPAGDGISEDVALRRHLHRLNCGDPTFRCRPIPLRRWLRWENVLNVGLDLQALWKRFAEDLLVSGDLVCMVAARLLLAAVRDPVGADDFPSGVGMAIASLRARGACPPDFPEQIGTTSIKQYALDHQLDLLKLAMSENPTRSVAEDLEAWVSGENKCDELRLDNTPLARAVWILDCAARLRLFREPVERKARQVLAERITRLFADIPPNPQRLSEFGPISSVLAAMQTRQDEVLKSFHNGCMQAAKKIDPQWGTALRKKSDHIARRNSDPHAVLNGPGPALALSFEEVDGTAKASQCPRCDPTSIGPVLNRLQVTYSTAIASATIPSPVLLLEDSASCPRYTQRQEFREADSTFARVPRSSARAIASPFNRLPAWIEFRLRRSSQHDPQSIGILWDHVCVGFPPAIDSQLLVAALQRWALAHAEAANETRSMLDVGCGTGYLASAAAFLCPNLRHVMLADVDSFVTDYAARNIRTGLRRPSAQSKDSYGDILPEAEITTWAGDFCAWKQDRVFDLVICNPPYLPELQLASSDLDRATCGTRLLENVVSRTPRLARRTFMVFSSLAWREFEDALASQSRERSRVCILGRHLVPLRVTPIEPLSPEEQQQRQEQPPDPFMAQLQFEQRKSYYRSALTPRGLIDLDLPEDRWEVFVRDRSINHHVRLYSEQDGAADLIDVSGSCPDSMEANLRALRAFSRGFRFWHETLIVLLES